MLRNSSSDTVPSLTLTWPPYDCSLGIKQPRLDLQFFMYTKPSWLLLPLFLITVKLFSGWFSFKRRMFLSCARMVLKASPKVLVRRKSQSCDRVGPLMQHSRGLSVCGLRLACHVNLYVDRLEMEIIRKMGGMAQDRGGQSLLALITRSLQSWHLRELRR